MALSLIWNMMAWLSYFLHLHPREWVSWLISNDRNWNQVWLTNVPTDNSLPIVLCRVVLFTVNLKSSYLRCVYRRESYLLSYYSNAAVMRILQPAAWQLKHTWSFFLQDFDVGKSYKKKILLTNISYTQNYCKYVGMSHILKDFIEVL